MIRGTVIRDGNKLFVRYVTTLDSEPIEVSRDWPIDLQLSWAAHRLVGLPVVSEGGGGFRLDWGAALEKLGDTIEYHQAQEAFAVLPQRGHTQAVNCKERPLPCPKVRKGIGVRYQCGRWEKLLRKGWVPA